MEELNNDESLESPQKRAPGCLGYIGDYTTQLCGDYYGVTQNSTTVIENLDGYITVPTYWLNLGPSILTYILVSASHLF